MDIESYHDNLLISRNQYYGKLTLEEAFKLTIHRTSSVDKRRHRNKIKNNLMKYQHTQL